jgi:hypothetical protein
MGLHALNLTLASKAREVDTVKPSTGMGRYYSGGSAIAHGVQATALRNTHNILLPPEAR